MNKTIGKYICAWAVVCLAGCSNEVPQEGQTAVASFHVATRAADNTAEREITDQQFVLCGGTQAGKRETRGYRSFGSILGSV